MLVEEVAVSSGNKVDDIVRVGSERSDCLSSSVRRDSLGRDLDNGSEGSLQVSSLLTYFVLRATHIVVKEHQPLFGLGV